MSHACKVLLVEDSEDDSILFKRALNRLPDVQLVAWVANGDAAIAYLTGSGEYANRQNYPWPDVMVLDLKMPGRNGFEVLEWLRGRVPRPAVAVFSTSDLPEDRQRAEQLGADVYQTKTFDANVFDRFITWLCRLSARPDPGVNIMGDTQHI